MSNKETIYEGPLAVRGKGIGFFAIPNSDDDVEDIVIERENLSFALDGDLVKVEVLPKVPGKRQEGKVIEVLEPTHQELIGTVKPAKEGRPERYLQPDNHRIHVRPQLPEATATDEGMKVVIEISSWKSPHVEPIAEITEVLGKAGEHETEMQAIMRDGGFAHHFPVPVQQAAEKLFETKDQIFKDAENDPKRRDIRGITTFTIDPADAKDFDDALSIQTLENGHTEVGIHIADVSHYVREGDAIDKEAQERGTSVYLVDRVIPMLPEVLSNDLCSLRPNVDRLAFSAIFELNEFGNVVNDWYGQTIIHSDKRFSYEEAQEILDKNDGEFLSELSKMMDLARQIRKRRYKAGAIAFEQPEVKFKLDEAGKPVDVQAKERTETMMMIEDFMLLANQHVTEYVYRITNKKHQNTAFIYRVHDVPNPDKIEELAIFIHALGYDFETKKGMVSAKDINKLMTEVEGSPEENLIKTATIRSMAKALYSTKNIGHFGLAFKHYTHFTSPIRRYPDLMAHRMLRKHLDDIQIGPKEVARYERLAVQCSEREIQAVRAERDSIKYKQVEYMLDKVGQTFDGVITGVTNWGAFVQEKNSQAEGLVRIAKLGQDYFNHEPEKFRIKGEKKGKTFSLGDEVQIKLTNADLENKQLDFVIL